MALKNSKNYQGEIMRNAGILKVDQIELVARSSAPSDSDLAEGRIYADSSDNNLYYCYDGTNFVDLTATAAGAADWDTIYDSDKTLTIDGTTLTFNLTHATNNGLSFTSGSGSGNIIDITNSGSGKDIDGTASTWSITKAGVYDGTDATLDSITIGDGTAAGTVDSSGDYDLTLQTGNSTTCDITLVDGNNGDVDITLKGTGAVNINGTTEGNDSLVVTNGDVAVSDGSFTLADDDNANSVTITNNTHTTGSASTGGIVEIQSTSVTTGVLLNLEATEAALAGGYYLRAYDVTGGAAVFTVGEDGAVVIAGNAGGTDALTLTVGDILLDDSDNNVIESENGTNDLLVLDNKAGAVGSGKAVLKVDAGGVVNAAGFGINAAFTGSAAAGATVLNVTQTADTVGIKVASGGVDTYEALHIDADSTDHDIAYIHSDAVIAADKALLVLHHATANLAAGSNIFRIDAASGIPNADARFMEIDAAAFTDTNEPYGIYIDAGGKKLRALHIDADPATNDVAYIHTDGATADNKAVLSLSSAGEPAAAGSNVLRVAFTGTATNTPTLVEVLGSGKDCRALYVDADPTALDVAHINCDSVIAADKGALQIVTTGAIAAGGTAMRFDTTGTLDADARVLEFDLAAVTDTNEPYGIFIDAGGKKVRAIYIDSDPIANDVVHIHSDAVIAADKGLIGLDAAGAMANGSAALFVALSGAPAATAYGAEFDMTGVTATNDPGAILVNGTGVDVRGIYVDTDNTDVHGVAITGSGALSGANALYVANDGAPAANTDALAKFAFTGTATNDPINVLIDHNSIGPAIDIDQDGNDGTDPAVGIRINTDNAGAGNQIALDVDQVDESKSYFARFNATTGWTSTKNPETDAETGWIKIMVGSTAYAIPYYALS